MRHWAMSKRSARRPRAESEGILPFKIDPEPIATPVTSFSGLPLVAEAFRGLGLDTASRQHLALKQRQRGFTEAQMVESFLLMLVGGGECLDDFTRMGEDTGLPHLLGYKVPSPDAARRFLYEFHDEAIMAKRPLDTKAWIPPESRPLQGLGQVNRDLIHRVVDILPPKDTRRATLDHDASIIESHKREAHPHYKGGRGYQPSFVAWAELDLVVAEEFRDGNVPAGMQNKRLIQQAFESLPKSVTERFFRADSACYEDETLSYLRKQGIGFAVSADMCDSLRKAIRALPEKAWKKLDDDRQWAEVHYVPDMALKQPLNVQPDRFLAVRWQVKAPTLFEPDGYRHHAIVTNLPLNGAQILAWHREKAGTIEAVHHVTKNELGMGIMPCGRFGADAAWVRLNILAYNLLSVLRRIALPKPLRKARPKRLRYEIVQLAGFVIRRARQTILKLAATPERIKGLMAARYQLAGLILAPT